MSSRATQRDFSQTPSRLFLIRNPFLVVRFVVFSLLIYMSLTALVFAAWNVGASRAAGAHVDGAASFLLFNSIAIPLCITLALAGPKISSFSASSVGFECAWTGVFALLQIAASIFVTLSGPPEFCDAKAPLSICASITILVPISWIAATLLLGYFVAILALYVAHLRIHPRIWSTSMYDIAWFDDGEGKRTSAPQLPPLDTSPINLSITPLPQPQADDDVENRPPAEPNREKPLPSSPNVWWGRMLPGRAGRDHPFGIRRPSRRATGHYYPSYQSATEPKRKNNNNREMEEPTRLAVATLPSYRPQLPGREWQQRETQDERTRFGVSPDQPVPGPSFMVDEVLNEDEPIPMGDRSQWVRAPRAPGPSVPPPPPSWRGGRPK